MFANPFSAPLHDTLASHVFGRFLPQRAAGAATLAAAAPVGDPTATEEEPVDLAQRVREVGEW